MTTRDLRELLASVPDNWEIAIEVVIGDDKDLIPIAGMSDTRWDHTLALVTEESIDRYGKLT